MLLLLLQPSAAELTITVPENLIITDTTAIAVASTLTDEQLSLTDSFEINVGITVAETLTATDGISISYAIPEQLNFTDDINVAVGLSVNENLTLTSAINILNNINIEAEQLSFSDSVIVKNYISLAPEQLTFTEELSGLVVQSIAIEANKLSPDTYVELFDFDASMLVDRNNNPGTITYLTNTPTGGGVSPLLWRNNNYYPLAFELTGVESRADGSASSRPTLTLSNVNKFFLAAVLSLGNLEGMKVTRWRTFYKFTDNGSDANADMHYPIDEWIVVKKVAHSKTGISFELSNALDRPGLRLPRKLILTDQGFPGVSRVRLR